MRTRSQKKRQADPMENDKDKIKYDEKTLISKKPNKELESFDMEEGIKKLTHHPFILTIGQRHSGKNIMMNELIYHLDRKFKYEHIFLFSATGKMNYKETWNFMKEAYIFDTLDKLKQIIATRKKTMSKSPCLIIFDDIAGMTSMGANGKRKNVKYNEELDFLATTCRHFSLSVIVSIQNRVLCSRTLRTNSSLTFLFPAKSRDDCVCIKNEYLGLAKSKDEVQRIYDNVYSKPYNMLVVEGYKSGVISVNDYCSQYTAPFPIRKFKTFSFRKTKRNNKKKEKDDLKIVQEQKRKNTIGLNFRISIYSDDIRAKNEENSQNEKAINIYGE